jgi:hypothetical protein
VVQVAAGGGPPAAPRGAPGVAGPDPVLQDAAGPAAGLGPGVVAAAAGDDGQPDPQAGQVARRVSARRRVRAGWRVRAGCAAAGRAAGGAGRVRARGVSAGARGGAGRGVAAAGAAAVPSGRREGARQPARDRAGVQDLPGRGLPAQPELGGHLIGGELADPAPAGLPRPGRARRASSASAASCSHAIRASIRRVPDNTPIS